MLELGFLLGYGLGNLDGTLLGDKVERMIGDSLGCLVVGSLLGALFG